MFKPPGIGGIEVNPHKGGFSLELAYRYIPQEFHSLYCTENERGREYYDLLDVFQRICHVSTDFFARIEYAKRIKDFFRLFK